MPLIETPRTTPRGALRTSAMPAVGSVYAHGTIADGDSVTIGGRVYEFDTGGAITGDVAVDISGGADPDDAMTALAAAIAADPDATYTGAPDLLNNSSSASLTLVAGGDDAPTLVASGTELSVSGTTFHGNRPENVLEVYAGTKTLTAADITHLSEGSGANSIIIGVVPKTTTVVASHYQLITSSGVVVSGVWLIDRLESNGNTVIYLNDSVGNVDPSAGDEASFVLYMERD